MPRKRRGTPRCNSCNRPIVFFRAPSTGNWRPFDPTPVDGRTYQGQHGPAYPIESGRAWRLRDLVEELMIRHQQGEAVALDEAYAFTWHVAHTCTTPTTDGGE